MATVKRGGRRRRNRSTTGARDDAAPVETCDKDKGDQNVIDIAQISLTIDNAINGFDDEKLASLQVILMTMLEKVSQKISPTAKPQQKQKKRFPSTVSSSLFCPVPKELALPLTTADLLSVGLLYAGFSLKRQHSVKLETNIERFKGFYGLEATTLVAAFTDVKNRFPKVTFRNLLLTMNWLTLYDKYVVLSGRWGLFHDTIGPIVIKCTQMIQSFLNDKTGLHLVDMNVDIPLTLDTSNFSINEMRSDPHSKYFNPKNYDCGLVSLCIYV